MVKARPRRVAAALEQRSEAGGRILMTDEAQARRNPFLEVDER
jgi:hypothetical protein